MAKVQSTSDDGPILRAKSVMVTGATRGIGLALVREMLKMPSTIEYLFASYRNLESESGQVKDNTLAYRMTDL